MRLLERERELGGIDGAIDAARDGGGRLVIVEAPAGLGKTSLITAAAERAEAAGLTCLRGRATQLEHDFAYGLVRQLLEPVVSRTVEADRERLFAGAAAGARPLLDASQPPSTESGPFATLHGLYWLMSNLAEDVAAPLVVLADDAQWADPQSLAFFGYLAPRLEELALVLVVAARSGEERPPELGRLTADWQATVMHPAPLSTGAIATVSRAQLETDVAPEFVTAVREMTGGNPFYVGELLREAVRRGVTTDTRGAAEVRGIGPAAVADALSPRLAGQPPAATALLRAVATLGDGVALPHAARLAGLGGKEATQAADLLAERAILRVTPALEFAHPIVREAVYASIGPSRRAADHAAAAELLIDAGVPEERVAAQLVSAEPAGDAERVALLRRAAATDLGRGAPAAAVVWLRRALAERPPEPVQGDVVRELGLAELRLASPAAIDHLAEAVELTHEPAVLAATARALALSLTIAGRADDAVRALEAAIARVETEERELALTLEADLQAHAQPASLPTRLPAARRLERHAALPGDTPGERLVLASLAFERARAADTVSEAAALLERGLAGGRVLAEQELDVSGIYFHLVIGLLAADELAQAEASLEQARAAAHRGGSIPALAYVLCHRAFAALRGGAINQAADDARTAHELLRAHGIAFGFEYSAGLLARALLDCGDVDAAERCLHDAGLDREIWPAMTAGAALEARALVHAARDRTRDGIEDLIELGRMEERWGVGNPRAIRWRSGVALGLAQLGEVERARKLAAEDLDLARRWGAPRGIGIALRVNALVDPSDESVELLRAAVAELARSPARLEYARTLLELGAALRRANRRAEARSILAESRDVAERCGARGVADRARTELRAAGGPTSDPQAPGAGQLTVSERRVAELAADGLSNPEIAQKLFVTRKTVETHLGRVYRKLGVPGRWQLREALGPPG